MEQVATKRLPERFDEVMGDLNTIMSNFDHQIEQDAADNIKGKELFGRYPGWNFNGKVWWDGQWNCEVWMYGSWRKTFSADSLERIMADVCDEYGNE